VSLYTLRPISDRTPFTGKHVYSDFDSTWSATQQLLARELRAINARTIVLEVDFRERDLRLDGQLRADARCQSPAVRLAFDSIHGPLVYATDRFVGRGYKRRMDDWQHNVRAIALGLEALRKVDRYGITRRGEQYAGWKALPPGSNAIAMGGRTKTEAAELIERIAIGDEGDARDRTVARIIAGDHPDFREIVRNAKAMAHPDRQDGNRALWDELERALHVLERSA
jgi:antitoxin (DNA-binding transcriptional repressor) of toxin-antitoxin stability system